jgi:hypothetical protein
LTYDDRLKAATRAVKAELVDWPDARQSAWNIAAAALRAAGTPVTVTDLPLPAVDAVEAALRNFLSRWADFTVHGTDLDSQFRGAAMVAVRETLAHTAEFAADLGAFDGAPGHG